MLLGHVFQDRRENRFISMELRPLNDLDGSGLVNCEAINVKDQINSKSFARESPELKTCITNNGEDSTRKKKKKKKKKKALRNNHLLENATDGSKKEFVESSVSGIKLFGYTRPVHEFEQEKKWNSSSFVETPSETSSQAISVSGIIKRFFSNSDESATSSQVLYQDIQSKPDDELRSERDGCCSNKQGTLSAHSAAGRAKRTTPFKLASTVRTPTDELKTPQKSCIDLTKEIINDAIAEKLDVTSFSLSNTFRIADLGCSIGPNTFFAVQNIIDAVELKFKHHGPGSKLLEFQVFFNDLPSVDFNALFRSLPPDRRYSAAGLPGSFYSRLFPKASLQFVHSSFTLQWLSQVPNAVVDSNSPAWNKGKICYLNAPDEVSKAFATQNAKDMESFLHARAAEVVHGGLMALIIPCRANGPPEFHANMTMGLLQDILVDMAKKGTISVEKLNAFNIPVYNPSPEELEQAVKENGLFSIEVIEKLPRLMVPNTSSNCKLLSQHKRAVVEELIRDQFGEAILDEVFDMLSRKLEEHNVFEKDKMIIVLLLLKRKDIDLKT